jgi:hypothetical protein
MKALVKARKVANLIANGSRAEECREDAVKAINSIDAEAQVFPFLYGNHTKKRKVALREFALETRKLKIAWNKVCEDVVENDLGADAGGVVDCMDTILNFGLRCEKTACDKRKLPKQDAYLKPYAVEQAYRLLKEYGTDKDFDGGKGSKFCQLASLLHGGAEPSKELDLSYLCSDFRSRQKKQENTIQK